MVGALRVAALSAVPTIVLGVVSVAAIVTISGSDGHRGSPLDWFRASIWLAGLTWGGPLAMSISGQTTEDEGFQAAFATSASLTFAPTVLLLIAIVAQWFWSRRDESRSPSTGAPQVLSRSVVVAIATGMAWGVLAFVTKATRGFGFDLDTLMGEDFGSSVSVGFGLNPLRIAMVSAILTLTVSVTARMSLRVAPVWPAHGELSRWFAAWWAAGRFTLGVAVFAVVGAGAYILVGAFGDTTGSPSVEELNGTALERFGVRLWGLGSLNAVLIAGGAAMGSDITASSRGTLGGWIPSELGISSLPAGGSSWGLFADGSGPSWLLTVLAGVLAVAVTSGWRGVFATSRGTLSWGTALRWAVVNAALWAAIAWLTGGSLSLQAQAGSGLGEDTAGVVDWAGRAGLSYSGVIGLAFLWGAASYLGAYLSAGVATSLYPRAMARVASPLTVHPSWAVVFRDLLLQAGRPVPVGITAAAERHVPEGDVRPLNAHRTTGRFLLLGMVSLASLVAAAGIAHSSLSHGKYGPEAAALSYLRTVAAGDARGALEMVVGVEEKRDLLTDAVLREQLKEAPMTEIEVLDDVQPTGEGTAKVKVRYALRGSTQEIYLDLAADEDDKRLGVFPTWHVVNPFATVEVVGSGSSLKLSGVAVQTGTYAMFPGTLTGVQAETEMYQANETTAWNPTPTSSSTVAVTYRLKQAITNRVKSAVVREIRACMAKKVLAPSGCPFEADVYAFGEVRKVRWSTDADIPTSIRVDLDGSTIRISGQIYLKVSYQDYSEFWTTDESSDVVLDMSGTARYLNKSSISVSFDSTSSGSYQ